MDRKDQKLEQVWKQNEIPVVFRDGKPTQRLLIRFPSSIIFKQIDQIKDEHKAEYFEQLNWIRAEHRRYPKWIARFSCWKIPMAWFEDVIKRSMSKYGSVYVIQPYRIQQKCAPACWNAVGVECECSCMGEHHGAGNPAGKWHIVSETSAVSWGEKQYSCRLIYPNQKNEAAICP
jgi:hypothetical protein